LFKKESVGTRLNSPEAAVIKESTRMDRKK